MSNRRVHLVPDPPTQSGCITCGSDLHHGLRLGDRVVMIAPQTARQHATIIGFSVDTADVWVDGQAYAMGHVHCKWLTPCTDQLTCR